MGVHTVHEQVQPLEEEFRIRTHVDKVCSLWPLNLDWDVQIFLHFRFAVFLKIRFVFLSNQHFMISKKVQSNLGPLELVANLATRWRHLPYASRKFCHHMMPHPMFAHFGHQMELFALIANLATCILLQIGTTCIGSKFGHEVAPLALVLKLATRLHQCIATLPWIALLALSVGIELVSSLARVTSVKFQQGVVLTHWHPDPKIGPQVYLGPIKMCWIWIQAAQLDS